MSLDIPVLLDRLTHRYPSLLVDQVIEYKPGRGVTAVKNVTVNEEYFQGHFPGNPLMPGVVMIETLMQVATLLLLGDEGSTPTGRTMLRGVNNAKFRKQVIPGDRLCLEVTLRSRSAGEAIAYGVATVADKSVAEAELLVGIEASTHIDPTATVHPDAVLGLDTTIGPNAIIGSRVRMGRACRIGASAIIAGNTELGDGCQVFPFASVGLIPQDLKYKGEETRVVIGDRNVIREFVTINRGTRGGGGLTLIGDDNVFMAYAHVAHDCTIGDRNIFANGATIGGHVVVEDEATISALSGIHQFCRVGRQAFIGGGSVVTMDSLPYSRTVGNRARIYGVNAIGLERRGTPPQTIAQLRHAYRYLLQSKLNTTQALARIDADRNLDVPEVRYLVEFIRSSKRGVILRRPPRRYEPVGIEE